ncbi:MAG: amidohydrolase family protein [Gemmatimonadales bacterium]
MTLDGPPVAGAAVLLDAQGRIAALGPAKTVPSPPGVAAIDLPGSALIPGLVNAHTHLELTGLDGQVEEDDFTQWIRGVRQLKAGLSADWFLAAARQGVRDAFAAGITTVLDTGDSGAVLPALAELGGAGVVYQEVFGPDPAQCAASMAGLEAVLARLRPFCSDRVRLGVSPHAPYTVSGPLYRAVAELAARTGLPIAVHLAESPAESRFVSEDQGPFADAWRARGIPPLAQHSAQATARRSPVAWLDAHGVLGPGTLCIHTVQLDSADRAVLAARGVGIAHCPVSNRRHGHGNAASGALVADGLVVGIGTDSVVSVGALDMFAELRAARPLLGTTARETLKHGTLVGAQLAGMAADRGALTVGRFGDIAAVRLPEVVDPDLVEELLLNAEAKSVVATFASGVVVYRVG